MKATTPREKKVNPVRRIEGESSEEEDHEHYLDHLNPNSCSEYFEIENEAAEIIRGRKW